MLPQIARHPPPLAQQFGDPGFAPPPFDPLPLARRSERPALLPLRSLRNPIPPSALAPLHRAYPVENHGSLRPGLLRANSSAQSFGGQYDDPSEHMLRRKTPNGTLAAGYDGTPVQWSSKAPPLKHVVLPLSEGTSDGQGPRIRSASVGWVHQPGIHPGGFNSFNDMRMNSDPGNWSQFGSTPDTAPAWGNLWTNQPTSYHPNNGMQIPTVLQPAYQPAPGPTASNDGGLYGPYWPDGRFVPYRPAAYREQESQYPNQDWNFNSTLQQQRPPTELLPPFPPASFRASNLPAPHGGHVSFAVESVHPPPDDRYATPVQIPQHVVPSIYSSNIDGSRTPTAHSSERGSNPQFKEKTLSWAHTIYVDLLDFLESKKVHRPSRQSHGYRTYLKNSIYPKPPRQPASSLGTPQWSGSEHDPAYTSRPLGSMNTPHVSTGQNNNYANWQGSGPPMESRYHRSSNSDASHYASPFQTPHHLSNSPQNKAKEALEMLTNLCEQSGWSWIDGMLLGGCLAYGLEEYHKALEWYSKIIALDSKYVFHIFH